MIGDETISLLAFVVNSCATSLESGVLASRDDTKENNSSSSRSAKQSIHCYQKSQ